MVKLSIIIPYYKTYEYTDKLLKVLIPQLTDETEVILVDDGCNETRLDEYKDKINIIHLEKNGGGGNACNIGLNNSKGQYIGFIDSDDMIASTYIKTLLKSIVSNADIIYMDWQDICTGEVIRRPDNYAYWKAIYKKEIVPEFKKEYVFHFDVPFYDTIKERAKTRHYVDEILYFYNPGRPGNLSSIETKFKEEERKKEIQKMVKEFNMIKVEVIEQFTLGDYEKIKETLERRNTDKYGELYVGDKFYCDKEMAEYLLGNNKIKRAVVKVIEVQPEEVKEEKLKAKKKTSK